MQCACMDQLKRIALIIYQQHRCQHMFWYIMLGELGVRRRWCAEAPFSSFEDALLDLTHGGEDLEIPWDEYDEADKRAAHGSRSAMN